VRTILVPASLLTIKETIWWPAKRNESTPDGAAELGPAAGAHQSANTGDDQPQINLTTARAVPRCPHALPRLTLCPLRRCSTSGQHNPPGSFVGDMSKT
jgi:hypothetical protein